VSTVAETLHEDSRARLRGMTAAERLAEALRLGERSVSVYAAAHRLRREEARRELERAAQAGRRPSRVMRDLAG
jgi:cell division inhibitor SulA